MLNCIQSVFRDVDGHSKPMLYVEIMARLIMRNYCQQAHPIFLHVQDSDRYCCSPDLRSILILKHLFNNALAVIQAREQAHHVPACSPHVYIAATGVCPESRPHPAKATRHLAGLPN